MSDADKKQGAAIHVRAGHGERLVNTMIALSPGETENIEDKCLKLAHSYEFDKDLGTAYAVKEVWRMSKQDYKLYMIGVGFTFLGSRLSGLCLASMKTRAGR